MKNKKVLWDWPLAIKLNIFVHFGSYLGWQIVFLFVSKSGHIKKRRHDNLLNDTPHNDTQYKSQNYDTAECEFTMFLCNYGELLCWFSGYDYVGYTDFHHAEYHYTEYH